MPSLNIEVIVLETKRSLAEGGVKQTDAHIY